MSCDAPADVSALKINITISEGLRWPKTRRDEELTLTTLSVRLLPDGCLAAKTYGPSTDGGTRHIRLVPVPNRPEMTALNGLSCREVAGVVGVECLGPARQRSCLDR
jgi:hypothetical protein